MSKKKADALRLALELLKAAYVPADLDEQRERAIKELEALAEQPAQGCEFCSHPLYAGAKCKNCGREQPAQQQEEPVAWVCEASSSDEKHAIDYWPGDVDDLPIGTKLYTSPPASKPWVCLTDEEIDECYYWKGRQWTTDELVRHVEAKLREKNA